MRFEDWKVSFAQEAGWLLDYMREREGLEPMPEERKAEHVSDLMKDLDKWPGGLPRLYEHSMAHRAKGELKQADELIKELGAGGE